MMGTEEKVGNQRKIEKGLLQLDKRKLTDNEKSKWKRVSLQ